MWPQRAAEGTGRDDTGEVARLRALCSEAARHLRTLPEQSPLKDVRMAERLEAAAGENTGEEREFVLGLRDLLNEMQLHDDTGDRHDAGYMSAVNEVREWLKRNAAASTQEGTRA